MQLNIVVCDNRFMIILAKLPIFQYWSLSVSVIRTDSAWVYTLMYVALQGFIKVSQVDYLIIIIVKTVFLYITQLS